MPKEYGPAVEGSVAGVLLLSGKGLPLFDRPDRPRRVAERRCWPDCFIGKRSVVFGKNGPAVRSASFCCRLAEAVSEWMRTDRIGCGGSEWLGGRGTNDFLSGRGCFRRIAICSVISLRGMGAIRKVCHKEFCVGNTSVRSGHAPVGIAGAQETIKKGAGRK